VRVPGLELSKIAFSKGEMDERVKQMKLMNEVMNLHIKEVNERLDKIGVSSTED
jgi:hypothetical protein